MSSQKSWSNQLTAGLLAGGATVIALHPIDLLKTRFQACTTASHHQAMQFHSKNGILKSLLALYHEENGHLTIKQPWRGIRNLYSGFSANLLASCTSWGVYFAVYHCILSPIDVKDRSSLHFFGAASVAGCVGVLSSSPFWMIKTRLCQDPKTAAIRYNGLWNCTQSTYRSEGILAFYRGLPAALLGTLHGSVQFVVYENLKRWYRKWITPPKDFRESLLQSTADFSATALMTMSSIAKLTASTATYPLQVLRCRMQLAPLIPSPSAPGNPVAVRYNYHSIVDVMIKIYRHEGILAFYKGIVPNTIRILPATCITFLVYERASALFTEQSSNLKTSPHFAEKSPDHQIMSTRIRSTP